jgi:ribonuclease HI
VKLELYADGAAVPNPGQGGWCAVLIEDGVLRRELTGAVPCQTTNNRMELLAILKAMRLIPRGAECVIYSDSQLAIDALTQWAARWQANDWRLGKRVGRGALVRNRDLVESLHEELQARKGLVRLLWSKGHAGNQWQEHCDRQAHRAALTAWRYFHRE